MARRFTDARLDAALEQARGHDPNYSDVGATLRSPAVGRQVRRPVSDFEGACEALRRWAGHAALGARLHPERPQLRVGETLLVVLRIGPVEILAPVRIVAVVDEGDRFGFAYGTLPGHPERGEESFVVERTDGGAEVAITVRARPGSLVPLVGAPVVLAVQRRGIDRYLEGLTAC